MISFDPRVRFRGKPAAVPVQTFVRIPKEVHEVIIRWAEAAYPHEGCGLLIGRFTKEGGKEVARLASLRNILVDVKQSLIDFAKQNIAMNDPGALAKNDVRLSTLPEDRLYRPEVGFAFDPSEYNGVVMKAEKEGLDVVGVIHTHPDHPPRPSEIDASQPFLAQWSNIIVAVEKGKTREMKSWFRETDDQPFDEEPLKIS